MFQDILELFETEATEKFLELLLTGMSGVFLINKQYKKNIAGFKGRYLFKSRDNRLTVSAIFENDTLKVGHAAIDHADVTINFRNPKALRDYILSPKPDILGSVLRQDVVVDGNFSYLFKFAYMAKHLQLMATGQV